MTSNNFKETEKSKPWYVSIPHSIPVYMYDIIADLLVYVSMRN